ncbi:hypothetical protein GTW38_07950, partial [Streptomyces sp. SID7804]|nr:hypothetical protein [Streptomyces sp. SID7804]
MDSRYLDDAAAADAVRAALAGSGARDGGHGDGAPPTGSVSPHPGARHDDGRAFRAVNSPALSGRTVWFKKCDSLLRGPVGAEAAAFAEGAGLLVVAPALPAARRVVRGGEVLA